MELSLSLSTSFFVRSDYILHTYVLAAHTLSRTRGTLEKLHGGQSV